jgi:hypothetical protein
MAIENAGESLRLGVLFSKLGKFFHQPAFTPGGVVLVNDALCSRPIETADRLQSGSTRLLRIG